MKQLRPRLKAHSLVAGVSVLVFFALCRPSSVLAAASPANQGPPGTANAPSLPVVEYAAGLLSVSAKSIDVRAVVEAIAAKSGIEIVLDKAITGKVTAEFKGMRFEDGLRAVLRNVLEGGFVSEYVRKAGSQNGFGLQKVVIAPRTAMPMPKWLKTEDDEVLRIDDMYVGEAKGEEVLFVPWGDGEGQIPIRTLKAGATEVRQGFARLRIGVDGSIYFIGWPHQRVWAYDGNGTLRGTIDLGGARGNSFDVDHEGNIYVIANPTRRNDSPQQEVIVYDSKLRELARVWTTYAPDTCNVVRVGVLRNACDDEKALADFSYLLKAPLPGSLVLKSSFQANIGPVGTDPLEEDRPLVAMLTVGRAHRLGIPQRVISAPYTQLWEALGPGSDRWHEIAYFNGRLYVLIGISTGMRFRDDYGVGVLDLERRRASYFRLAERDTFVYEGGDLSENFRTFDIDPAGNVFRLLTTKKGVHVLKYRLEDGQ